MKPAYTVRAREEDGWWLARVVAAGEGADPFPLHALTQATSLAGIGEMAGDLIATILDAAEQSFDSHIIYDPAQGDATSAGKDGGTA